MASSDNAGLTWRVWSVGPNGFRPLCRRTFPYDGWQFAEKVAHYLRELGHEDVRVELACPDEEEEGED